MLVEPVPMLETVGDVGQLPILGFRSSLKHGYPYHLSSKKTASVFASYARLRTSTLSQTAGHAGSNASDWPGARLASHDSTEDRLRDNDVDRLTPTWACAEKRSLWGPEAYVYPATVESAMAET